MSVNKMSDEELDNLFRRSAENLEPPFDPEAWKAMDQKLDQAMVRLPWYRRHWPLLLIFLLLVPFSISQVIDENSTPAKDEIAAVVPETPRAAATAPQKQPAHMAENPEVAGAGEAKPGAAAEKLVTVSPAPAENAKAAPGIYAKTPAVYRETAVAQPSEDKATQAAAIAAEEAELTDTTHAAALPAASQPDTEAGQHIAQQALDEATDSVLSENPAPAVAADSSKAKTPSPFFRSIRIALLAAPDFTTVRFKNPEAVSANAGVVVGVPLTDRLSLLTGVVWANKVYGASLEDYNPGPYYWQGKAIPDDIDARCLVLDIPLNLEYRLLQRNKGTLAVQAGFSSYIMLDEKYTYIYGSGYGTYEKVWEVKNQNRHWFAVQNISLSYTRHLTPSLFVGAEPFVKIPLADIGAGNVKLTSAGVFFTAGYTLPLRK